MGGGTAANDTSPPSVLDTGGNDSNNTIPQSTATSSHNVCQLSNLSQSDSNIINAGTTNGQTNNVYDDIIQQSLEAVSRHARMLQLAGYLHTQLLDTGGNISNNTTPQSTVTSVTTYDYENNKQQLQLFLQQHPELRRLHSLTCHSRVKLELLTNKKVQLQPTEDQCLQLGLHEEKLRSELELNEEKLRQKEKLCPAVPYDPTLNYEEITHPKDFFARELWKTLPQPLQAKFTLLAECWDAKDNVVLEEKREEFNAILEEVGVDITSVKDVHDYKDIALLLRTQTHSKTIHNTKSRDPALFAINKVVYYQLVEKKRMKKIVLINVRPWETEKDTTPLTSAEADVEFKQLLLDCGYSETEADECVAKANTNTGL